MIVGSDIQLSINKTGFSSHVEANAPIIGEYEVDGPMVDARISMPDLAGSMADDTCDANLSTQVAL